MKQLNITNSFIQDTKFETKSDRFQHVTPSNVAQVMSNHGFELVSLKSGHARTAEKANHQTTLARYRHVDQITSEVGGLQYDIIAKIPHLYGAIELFAGIFRLVCSNGLVTGTTFESYRIRHVGETAPLLNQSIEGLVAARPKVTAMIDQWTRTDLNDQEIYDFALKAVSLRTIDMVSIQDNEVLKATKARRLVDQGTSLWNVYNRLQENLRLNSYNYVQSEVQDDKSIKLVDTSTRRMLRDNSQVALDFNRDLFDLASRYNKVS